MSLLRPPQPARLPELSASKPTWVRWQIIVFVMLFIFAGHFNRKSLTVAADMRIMKDYKIQPEQMGYIYSSFLVVYTLCMVPGGLMIDRIGVRRAYGWLGIGLTLAAAVTIALYFAYGSEIATFSVGFYVFLLLTRVLMGLAAAPMHPASAATVGHWIPLGAQTWANGLIVGMCPLGVAFTDVAMTWMIERFDWPTATAIMGAATLTLTIAWLCYATDRPEHHRRVNAAEVGLISAGRTQIPADAASARESEMEEDLEELRHEMVEASIPYESGPTNDVPIWRDRNLLVLTLSYSLNGYFQYLFIYWLHYYFYEHLNLDPTKASRYSALPFVAMAAGMPLGGLISDLLLPRVGRLRSRVIVAIAGLSAATLFLFVALTAEEPAWISAWFSLSLGSIGIAEPAYWATVIDSAGKRGGTATAFLNAGNNGFGVLAPVITAYVSQRLGWNYALALAGCASLVAAICWFWVKPTVESPVPAEAQA